MKLWTLSAAAAAAAFFALALSNAIYEATSPWSPGWHVVLRKTYSIAAFAVVGYLLRRALNERGHPAGIGICSASVAVYSAAIEVGQALIGSREGLLWNALDVACGALGGVLACADLLVRRR